MQDLRSLTNARAREIRVLLTDIDGTLTEHGRLPPHSYVAIDALTRAGVHVVPVTGRPAGWCELIARLWPVHGVVGENGAFYFRYDGKKMRRHFARARTERAADRKKLRAIRAEVLREVPGCAIASDQFSRLFDLAVDFAEDVSPMSNARIADIVRVFERHGATAKVSNIHVNGWFGDHDKRSTCGVYLKKEFGFSEAEIKAHCAFVGDSPNDEPMFAYLPTSFGVANIRAFTDRIKHTPAFVTKSDEGLGFVEVAERLLESRGPKTRRVR